MAMHSYSVRIRPFVDEDKPFIMSLAPRLTIGMASWRDDEKKLKAIQGWLEGSIAHVGKGTMIFIAENEHGKSTGFATVTSNRHFTGTEQAYIGELAVDADAESHGVGQALIAACEQWAREQGYSFLVLETGIANTRARKFYAHAGFQEEDVRLTKVL